MEKIVKTGRIFYGFAMAAVGIHQLFYSDFCLMLFPHWPSLVPGLPVIAWIGSIALIAAGLAIIFEKKTREVSLILGAILLAIFLFIYVPYEILKDPYSKHIGSWVSAFKEFALAGGAFAIAGSLPAGQEHEKTYIRFLEKFIPFGSVLFSITMIDFGIGHFLYIQYVAQMVPDWISAHVFWTYFAGVALIAAGSAIILRIWLKPVSILLGIMIFIWFVTLHIPGAIEEPLVDKGNEIVSAFSALAFSGIAFVISGGYIKTNNEKNLQH
jgi:uncharacterized membrane protein YphA (DoxX/SURF4 family)